VPGSDESRTTVVMAGALKLAPETTSAAEMLGCAAARANAGRPPILPANAR
jgi:hypothetical protein